MSGHWLWKRSFDPKSCIRKIERHILPPATKLGQGYIFTGVCDSVNRGVCLSACWDTIPRSRHPPWEQTPPWSRHPPRSRHPRADTPPEQTPPVQSMLGDTFNAGAVRILLECNLVRNAICCPSCRTLWSQKWHSESQCPRLRTGMVKAMSWIRSREWRIKTSVFIELSDARTGHINSDHLVQITWACQLLSTLFFFYYYYFPSYSITLPFFITIFSFIFFSRFFSCFTRIADCSSPVTGANNNRWTGKELGAY